MYKPLNPENKKVNQDLINDDTINNQPIVTFEIPEPGPNNFRNLESDDTESDEEVQQKYNLRDRNKNKNNQFICRPTRKRTNTNQRNYRNLKRYRKYKWSIGNN